MNRPKGLKYQKHKENPTSFRKGQTPWNKGKIGVMPTPWNKSNGKGYINSRGYLIICKEGKEYLAHRLIWEKYNGTIPEGFLIHHKDRNKLNNDIMNLELTTREQHGREHYDEKKSKFTRRRR